MACKQALVMSSHDDDRRALRSERPPRTAKRTTRSLIQRASVWIMFTTLLSRKRPSNPGPYCSQLSVPCVVRVRFVSKAISGTSTCIEDPLRPRPGPVGPGPGVLLNVGGTWGNKSGHKYSTRVSGSGGRCYCSSACPAQIKRAAPWASHGCAPPDSVVVVDGCFGPGSCGVSGCMC